jgi:hypothetical protein
VGSTVVAVSEAAATILWALANDAENTALLVHSGVVDELLLAIAIRTRSVATALLRRSRAPVNNNTNATTAATASNGNSNSNSSGNSTGNGGSVSSGMLLKQLPQHQLQHGQVASIAFATIARILQQAAAASDVADPQKQPSEGASVLLPLVVQPVRCAFFGRNLHSRMPLSFTPLLRLKRADVWPMAVLSEVHFSYQFTL